MNASTFAAFEHQIGHWLPGWSVQFSESPETFGTRERFAISAALLFSDCPQCLCRNTNCFGQTHTCSCGTVAPVQCATRAADMRAPDRSDVGPWVSGLRRKLLGTLRIDGAEALAPPTFESSHVA